MEKREIVVYHDRLSDRPPIGAYGIDIAEGPENVKIKDLWGNYVPMDIKGVKLLVKHLKNWNRFNKDKYFYKFSGWTDPVPQWWEGRHNNKEYCLSYRNKCLMDSIGRMVYLHGVSIKTLIKALKKARRESIERMF